MNNTELKSIFEQIENLKKPDYEAKNKTENVPKDDLQEILIGISQEIQRVLDENNFTQDNICKVTGMSQSNISKIQNGKVVPKIETLQKIAQATHKRLVISFENTEGDES